jgi:hypothetical protein
MDGDISMTDEQKQRAKLMVSDATKHAKKATMSYNNITPQPKEKTYVF